MFFKNKDLYPCTCFCLQKSERSLVLKWIIDCHFCNLLYTWAASCVATRTFWNSVVHAKQMGFESLLEWGFCLWNFDITYRYKKNSQSQDQHIKAFLTKGFCFHGCRVHKECGCDWTTGVVSMVYKFTTPWISEPVWPSGKALGW